MSIIVKIICFIRFSILLPSNQKNQIMIKHGLHDDLLDIIEFQQKDPL